MSAKKAQTTSVKKTPSRAAKKPAAAKTATKTEAVAETVETAQAAAITKSAVTPPAKAKAVSPAVKAEAKAPAIKASKPPVVKEKAVLAKVETPKAASAVKTDTSKLVPIMPGAGNNPYLPHVATIVEVVDETHNIKTFRVVLDDAEAMRNFSFGAGQVGQLSLFGVGEATFVINSPPSQKNYLQFSVMRAGEVTDALHKLSAGDKVGVRAPLGTPFPSEAWKGKDIFFIGGGIGMAPIRTIMLHVLENKADYGKVSLLYGARSPRDMAYSYELDGWMRDPNLDCTLTIDNPFDGWEHKVGLLPNILLEIAPKPDNTIVVLCGPPIMIKFTVEALKKLEFPDEQIITTLEKRMKCGIGICGRCNIGSKYVCVDGPVFSWAELKNLPPEL